MPTKFTSSFDEIFIAEDIRSIRTLVRDPRANAFAERFAGTVRRECLDRPHRSLGQQAPLAVEAWPPASDPEPTQLHRTDAVFGLIHEYGLVA